MALLKNFRSGKKQSMIKSALPPAMQLSNPVLFQSGKYDSVHANGGMMHSEKPRICKARFAKALLFFEVFMLFQLLFHSGYSFANLFLLILRQGG